MVQFQTLFHLLIVGAFQNRSLISKYNKTENRLTVLWHHLGDRMEQRQELVGWGGMGEKEVWAGLALAPARCRVKELKGCRVFSFLWAGHCCIHISLSSMQVFDGWVLGDSSTLGALSKLQLSGGESDRRICLFGGNICLQV